MGLENKPNFSRIWLISRVVIDQFCLQQCLTAIISSKACPWQVPINALCYAWLPLRIFVGAWLCGCCDMTAFWHGDAGCRCADCSDAAGFGVAWINALFLLFFIYGMPIQGLLSYFSCVSRSAFRFLTISWSRSRNSRCLRSPCFI